jgi:hypothetical protein
VTPQALDYPWHSEALEFDSTVTISYLILHHVPKTIKFQTDSRRAGSS